MIPSVNRLSFLKTVIAAAFLTSVSYSYSWDRQVVDSNLELTLDVGIDLAFDANGIPHIVYFENKDDDNRWSLAHAFNDGSGWNSTTIEQDSFDTAKQDPKVCLAIDTNGIIYVAYPDQNDNLFYREKQNGIWSSRFNIDTKESLVHDVAVDNNGLLYVLYSKIEPDANYKDATLILYIAGDNNDVDTHSNFQSASLALDSNSTAHLSYYDQINGLLKYAVRDGNSWIIQEVNNVGSVSSYVWGATSIALDSNDIPHISYYNYINPSLKYANKLLGSWQSGVVDANVNIESENSIAMDSNDIAHICYFALISGKINIKYAVNKQPGWQIETVVDFNAPKAYLSMALDDSDKPHIAFTVPASHTIEHAVPKICGNLYHPFLDGDADKNCFVDFFDLSLLGDRWLDTGCGTPDYCDGADLNKSTIVDNSDLYMLADTWLECSLSDCF